MPATGMWPETFRLALQVSRQRACCPARQSSALVAHSLMLTPWLPPAGLGMGVMAAGLGLIFMRIHKIIHKLTRAVGLHVSTPLSM